jgi:tetratricopeptide (TPR) repeat protein
MSFHRSAIPGALLGLILLFGPVLARAQAGGLSPQAQASVDRGLADAGQQNFAAAKDDFLQAWRQAPDDPRIWYYLGLSEAKLPGYELRSIAWFKLYLLRVPDARNAEAIRTQIAGLETVFEARLGGIVDRLEPLVLIAKARRFPGQTPDVLEAIHEGQLALGWNLAGARYALGDVANAERGLVRTNGDGWRGEWEGKWRAAVTWRGPPGSLGDISEPAPLFTAAAAAGQLRQAAAMARGVTASLDVTDNRDELYDADPVAFVLEQGDDADARRLAANPYANRVVRLCSPDDLVQDRQDFRMLAPVNRCRDDLWWSTGRAAFLLKTAVNGVLLSLAFDDLHMLDYVTRDDLADPRSGGLSSVTAGIRRLALEYRKVRGPRS